MKYFYFAQIYIVLTRKLFINDYHKLLSFELIINFVCSSDFNTKLLFRLANKLFFENFGNLIYNLITISKYDIPFLNA